MIDEIRAALDASDGVPEVLAVHEVRVRAWSWQADIDTTAGAMFLKVPRPTGATSFDDAATDEERIATRAEFSALEGLAAVTADHADLAAVRPVAYLAPINGILLERFEGRPLRSVARPLRGWDREALLERIGRAMALFHSLHGIERVGFRVADETERLSAALAVLDTPGHRLLREVSMALSALAAYEEMLEPVGVVHGDLNLDNVLIDRSGRPALIDPNPRPGPLLTDRALFLGDLRRDRAQLLSRGLWRRIGPESVAAFDAGAGTGDEPVARARETIEIMERWIRLRTSGGVAAVVLRTVEGRLAGALRRSVAALGG